MEHQQQRLHRLRRMIADSAQRPRQGFIELAREVHGLEKLAEEGQPSMGGKLLVGGVALERKDGLCHHFFISLVSGR